ncbi:MAG: tetratricopeptide repeat protein [Pseudomonadota bacterium]
MNTPAQIIPLFRRGDDDPKAAGHADAQAKRCLAAGDLAGAVRYWRKALTLSAQGTEIRFNLARALTDLGRGEAAEALYLDLIRAVPGHADALYNLGNLRLRCGDARGAVHWYRRAVAAAPEKQEPRLNLGMALKSAGRPADAEAVYRETTRRWAGCAEAHWNLAVLLLSQGRWAEGFAEYQWRLKRFEVPGFQDASPWWDGRPAPDRHLLLWAEQGVGDAIHFLRYVPAAAARAGRVTVCCHPGLKSLARRAVGVDRVLAFGESLPAFDLHAPLMSLPHLLGRPEPVASWQGPYIDAPLSPVPPRIAPGRCTVGLVWSGNPDFVDNARRACPPDLLRPLVDCPGAIFYALQKGAAAESAGKAALGDRVHDLAPGLNDFADTAGAIARLEMIVTVDTAVAHLAGAMGKPVWVMLHHAPDWRWLGTGETTAWYPTMRLFRQKTPGDWQPVIREIRRALALKAGPGMARCGVIHDRVSTPAAPVPQTQGRGHE